MTQVYFEQDGPRRILSAKGHATGSEIVCAAISGILYALAGYLRNAEGWGKAEVFTCSMESGDVILDAVGGAGVDAAFEVAVIGLLQIGSAYPELLRVEEHGVPRASRPTKVKDKEQGQG